ncbi:putative clathrin coat assembly protein [Babesia divergens]|uniref:Clathrin coat assembly protein n=1 Tax=Babesia divergens TaxID=32595 RepID=A0AAD9GK71_BABDI|nr:putative clathrin coat assembly protein [Babesia divergens]
MAISQFLVISNRGDTLLLRRLRGDCVGGSAEEFYSSVTERSDGAAPIFRRSGMVYYYIRRSGLYFVATTSFDMPPSFVFELINRIIGTFKDFCGVLSEESLKRNFVLAYELLDEMLDFGYVQCTNASQLKQKVYNVAVVPKVLARPSNPLRVAGSANPKTVPSTVSQRPLAAKHSRSSEIFVDVLEKMSVVLGSNDTYKSMTIEGQIQIKSFLQGHPPVRIALNEGLIINNRRAKTTSAPVLDFCSFHQSVATSDFEKSRILAITPPEGEFTLMSYRISGGATLPFKVKASVETTSESANLTINLYCSMPQHLLSNVNVKCTLPSFVRSASLNMITHHPGQTAEYNQREQAISWVIKRFRGCTGMILKASVSLEPQKTKVSKREFGPINVTFEAPMYSASNVHVRYMRIMQSQAAVPAYRWVRYITTSSSYLYRF